MSEGVLAHDGVLPPHVVNGLWESDADSKAPLYLADGAGRLIYANDAYTRIAPFLEKAGRQPTVDEVATAVDALRRPLRQDHILEIDGRMECYVSERMVVQDPQGRPFAVLGRFVPSDEIKRLEGALTLAEDRLDDITRLVSDWVWETDAALALTFVSHRVIERLGIHPREFVGRPLFEIAVDAPASGVRAEAVDRRRPFRDVPVEMRHRDNSRRNFLLSAVPVFDTHTGAFAGYRGTAHDVTEREARRAALIQAVVDAEAANRAKTEFLANMSHELRTPLNAIMGFSEVMSLEVLGPIGHGRYREYAEDILTSSRHLLRLINDILDIAKIEAGKLVVDEGVIAIDELLADAGRFVEKIAERSGVTIIVEPPGGLRVRADERRLKQVLLNLLSNAVKFTPAGGMVTLSTRAMEDGGIAFVVADTGIGIAPDEIERAMAPFSQIESGLARRYEGTGLGLPLSKALTEQHGGTLSLESEPGVGTTVTVRLPPERVLR
ncbi:MAG: PAS domain-containing sensor histidine kinase [Alphaproteobacteria bacterium]